jgi:hypothetical protein
MEKTKINTYIKQLKGLIKKGGDCNTINFSCADCLIQTTYDQDVCFMSKEETIEIAKNELKRIETQLLMDII